MASDHVQRGNERIQVRRPKQPAVADPDAVERASGSERIEHADRNPQTRGRRVA